MIEIQGQYIFDMQVGNYKDFIESRDLVEFTLIEEAGNTLPSFDLKFRFSIPELRSYLIENNVIRITIGSSDEDKVSIPLRIFKKDLQNYGQNRFYIEISGFYDALGYMKGSHTESVTSDSNTEVSGFGAIKQVVSRFFTFETNIDGEDSGLQKWLCCRKSYREFITDIWYRMGLSNKAIPLVAITKNGAFRLFNSDTQVKSKPKYRLSNRPAINSNDIRINGTPEITNDAGAVNSMVQNRINRVYDMIKGGYQEVKFTQSPIIAMTSDLDSFNVERKDGYDFLSNDNVFSGYWNNYLHNISSFINLSTARLTVSFIGKYIEDLHVLDMVEYLEGTDSNINITEGLYSGKYLISKVVRTIGENKNFQTHLVLTRESFNELIDYTREVNSVSLEVQENNDYTQAISKINDVMNQIKDLLSLKGLKLNLPNIRILAQELESLTSTLFGFDDNGIWIKLEHVLSSLSDSLIFDILKTTFDYLSTRGETVYLSEDNSIILELTSGTYDSFIDMGYLVIPNMGATSLKATEYTASTFGWYVQDKLTDTVETGNASLNNLLLETLAYLKDGAIINQQDSAVFRRYWGSYNDININEDELKQLYSDESIRRYIHKIFVPKGYVYIAYPSYMEVGTVRVDGEDYKVYLPDEDIVDKKSFKVNYKSIKINNKYYDYIIYRSNVKFSNKITLEII